MAILPALRYRESAQIGHIRGEDSEACPSFSVDVWKLFTRLGVYNAVLHSPIDIPKAT